MAMAWSGRRGPSIVLRTLLDPGANGVSVTLRQLLLAVRHPQRRRCAPVEQPHQIAGVRVARDNHLAELGALHDAFVTGQVEPAFLQSFAPGLMTAGTSPFQQRKDVLGKTLLVGGA